MPNATSEMCCTALPQFAYDCVKANRGIGLANVQQPLVWLRITFLVINHDSLASPPTSLTHERYQCGHQLTTGDFPELYWESLSGLAVKKRLNNSKKARMLSTGAATSSTLLYLLSGLSGKILGLGFSKNRILSWQKKCSSTSCRY